MKKKALFIFLIILFTIPFIAKAESSGIVNYNLTITDKYTEEITTTFPKNAYKTALEDKSDIPPLEYIFLYDKLHPIKTNLKSEYNKKIETTNNGITVKLDYTYNKDEFKNATFLNNCFEYFQIKESDYYNEFAISGSFYCLHNKTYNITVTSNTEIEDINTGKKSKTLNWMINKNNVKINFKVEKEDNKKETFEPTTKEEEKKSPLVLILVLVLIVLLFIVSMVNKKK